MANARYGANIFIYIGRDQQQQKRERERKMINI